MLTQLKAVDVRSCSMLEDKDEFMALAIESAHAAIVLGPDNQVLEFGLGAVSCRMHLLQMSPVHAYEVDGAINCVLAEVLKRGFERDRKLANGHFARGLRKLAVLDFAQP